MQKSLLPTRFVRVTPHRVRLLLLSPCLLLASFCWGQTAAVKFARPFAPQDGLVAPSEKPYRSEVCLNGYWQFQPMSLPSGFPAGRGTVPDLPAATENGWDKTPIRIPSPWNVNTFPEPGDLGGDFRCFPSYPASWNAAPMGWLRRSFTVPASWKGQRVRIHFQAVAGEAQILVNNKPVGQHFDNFLPFTVDVTEAIRYGETNELRVGVRKASLFDVPGRYGRRPYQGGSMWGQHIVGIWQDVFLEAVPVIHIDDVFIKPQLDRDTLEAEVTVRNDGETAATVTLTGDTYRWVNQAGKDTLSAPEPKGVLDKKAVLQTAPQQRTIPPHDSVTITLSAEKVGGRLNTWSPESPNLYGLVCRLTSDGKPIRDTKYTRFGWRQITFQGARVLLNGKPLVLRGDSWHFMGIPQMTRRYAWAWYKALKDAHLNAVRLHAQPYPAFYLDVADEQGILVLDEDAVWASDGGPKIDDPAFWTNTETHLRGLILRDRNHPSVFGWSVSNEMMAVVRNVFRAPQEFQDKTRSYYSIWTNICRTLDPTRLWISGDGEDDGGGAFPVYIIHYGGTGEFERATKTGKPWGVGEAGPAYYGTPEQIAKQSGNGRAYLSFADRMDGVATVSYQSLADQNTYNANYRSVFNLVWYGLKPLELGMRDTTRPPTLTDGITFPAFVEGKPGVQPERLGPYSTTLNPGYDPRLPLYLPWPLFDAIRNASAEPPIAFQPTQPTFVAGQAKSPTEGTIRSARVLAGPNSTLGQALTELGVPISADSAATATSSLLFIDGAIPPSAESATSVIERTLDAGGTVFVWGATPASLPALNTLLPYPLELTARTATSLVMGAALPSDPLTAGITPASLYFSELSPSQILSVGLGGPLVAKGKTLLAANNTDWQRWNRQPETTKTAMVFRSEREAKPSGAALVTLPVRKGRLLVCSLPVTAQTSQAATLNRTLLANLGVVLGEGTAQRNVVNAQGMVTRALALGRFSAPNREAALAASFVEPNSGAALVAGSVTEDRTWTPVTATTDGGLDLRPLRGGRREQTAISYVSFWLYSPKALDNLLLDPNLPTLDLVIGGVAAEAQVWLNARSIKTGMDGERIVAATLPVQQGWNHVLIKVVFKPAREGENNDTLSLLLRTNQPDYLPQLRGTQEKP